MGIDFEGIKRLPPDEQVKSLRLVLEQLKKEISDREGEIKTAERLIKLAEEASEAIEQVEVPTPSVTEQLQDVTTTTAPEDKEPPAQELEERLEEERRFHEEQRAYETPQEQRPGELYRDVSPSYAEAERRDAHLYERPGERDAKTAYKDGEREKTQRADEEKKEEHLKTGVEKMLDDSYK